MFTERADWFFIIPAGIVWSFALLVIAFDFVRLQGGIYHFSPLSLGGIVLTAFGIALRVAARMTLGKRFTHGLRIIEGHVLVRSGVYRHVRHPAYTGALLFSYGTPLIFSSTFGFFAMLPLIALFLYRIRIEERILIKEFGDQYREYQETSWRLVPLLY